MTNDKIISLALTDCFNREIETLESLYPDEHIFSKRHQRQMKRLFRKQCGKIAVSKPPIRKAFVYAIVVILSTAVLALGVYATIQLWESFSVKQYDIYAMLSVTDVESAPKVIAEKYRITANVTGYSEEVLADEAEFYTVCYTSNDKRIIFDQSTKEAAESMRLNTENAVGEINSIELSDCSAVYYETYNHQKCLIWDSGEYILQLCASNVGETALIEMANSVQKVE